MGQRRTFELKFAGGLDERISKRILPDGLLRELHDQRMDQLGRVVRRPGRYMAGNDGDVIGSDATPRAVFAQGARLSMLTPRRQYVRSEAGVWSDVGPSMTINSLNATPVKTCDVPVATYAPTDWAFASNVRRGVAECCSAALSCVAVSGSYVLVAQRSDVDLGTGYTQWGYVTLHGYRYWEDQYGLPHWDEVMRKTLTGHYAQQLRVWTCGASIICGYATDEGTTWGLVLQKWAPRTSLTTVTETTLYTGLTADSTINAWDIASTGYTEAGKSQYALAISIGTGPNGLRVVVLDEDNTTVHTAARNAPDGVAFSRVAACWNGSTSISVYACHAYPTDYNHEVFHFSVHAVYASTTDLGDTGAAMGAPKTAAVAVPADTATKMLVWLGWEVTQAGGTLAYDHYWYNLNGTAPFAIFNADTMYTPGRMVSKPFDWGSEQACWFVTGNEDLADRSYVLCRIKPSGTIEQCSPLAVVSPNQAGSVLTTTLLSEVSFVDCPGVLGTPDRWFWCAPETYTGSTIVSAPDMAPRAHAWGVLDQLPAPVVVDGSQVWSCEGVPAIWGAGGRQELQPVMGPGLLHATVDAGTGNLADGVYLYKSVYRVVRPDGTVVRSKPGPSCSGTMAGGPGHMRLFVRPPRCSCISAGADAAPAIFVDFYRTTASGSLYYYVGSAEILPQGVNGEYEFDDALADASIIGNETLYTTATDEKPAAGVPSFTTMRAHGGRIFGAHGKWLWYSTQRASDWGPYFPAGARLPVESEVTALASTEMGLVVFTRNSTWLLGGDGPGPNLQPFWPPLRLLSRDVGCVSQCSVHEWRDGTFFQSDRGIEVLRKTGQIELHSGKVQEKLQDYPIVRRVLEDKAAQEIRFLCSTAGAWPGDSDTPGCLSRWLCWDYGADLWRTEECLGMTDAATVVGSTTETLFEVTRTGANSLAGWQCWRALYWYDETAAATYAYPVRSLLTGTIRPGGVGGWGRLRRVRLYGEPAVWNSGITGNKVTITVRQHSEVDLEVSSAHAIEVRAPRYGATAEQVLLEVAPTTQLCSEFDLQVEEDTPTVTGSLFVQCACSDIANHALSGLGTVDGVTLVEGVTIVALLGQSAPAENGAWVAKTAGWTRATTLPAGAIAEAFTLRITGGTARAGYYYGCTSSPSVVGTNSLTYAQVNTTGDGLAGEGTAWTALAFDWEDLSNRPRTTSTLRA